MEVAAVQPQRLARSRQVWCFPRSYQKDNVKMSNTKPKHIWNVQLEVVLSEHLLAFDYYHGLSTPSIYPAPTRALEDNMIDVSDDTVLVFGMLEGSSKVHGKRVIYDPQKPSVPASL